MIKDFDDWNEKKKRINDSEFKGFIHEREIWWSSLGLNIGDEEDGKNQFYERPVLIIKKFNRDLALIVPLTSKIKDNKYYITFSYGNDKIAAIISQIRLISTKRLIRRQRRINGETFRKVKESIMEIIS